MATTTVAASSGGANAKGKLVGKDYITLAIFGVLLFLVFMVFAMVLGMNANLFWFTHACGSLIGGIVWMYVAAKVPKRGAFAIMSAIVAVVALAATAVCPFVGGWIGSKLFKKHFAKISA